MREYAALKTRAANEEDLLADRYIDYYRTTCLSAAPGARFRLADWLAWAELELRQHSCGAGGVRGAPRLCPWIGYRGLAALLLGDPRHHREHPLAGPTAALRGCLPADACQRLLPDRKSVV